MRPSRLTRNTAFSALVLALLAGALGAAPQCDPDAPLVSTPAPVRGAEAGVARLAVGLPLIGAPAPKLGGVKTVINQRHASELEDFDERAVVGALGLAYYNPAWNGADELTDEILDETRELLRTVERPVLIHCSSANRTGATWFAFRVLDEGLSLEAGLDEAKLVGLRSPDYERIVRNYIARRMAAKAGTR